ncbi:MAG: hypothetical protein H6659_09950 [Ardenticatenaceae bacterium]|nr:hypothetical protein [Ardenticatenaceae bacterium]
MTAKEARRRALERQIARLDGRLTALRRSSDQYARWRLGSFLAALVLSAGSLLTWGIWAWVGVTAVAILPFIFLVQANRRIDEAIARYAIWQEIKQTHAARMDLDWANIPAAPPPPPRLDHPFALDLDLLGDHSLLQLLDTAVSLEGSQRLRDWLLETEPEVTAVSERQPLVAELAAMPRFRDKLALQATLAAGDGEKWPGQRILAWLNSQTEARPVRPVLWLLSGLAVVNLALLGLNLAGVLPALWSVSWAIYGLIFATRFGDAAPIFEDAYFLEKNLRRLGVVFSFLERYPYGGRARVAALCAPFLDEAERPSRHLRTVTTVLTLAGLRQNPFLWFSLNALVPWDLFVADRLRICQAALRSRLPGWLDRWFELEALNSLATFAYLNPEAVYPTIHTGDGPLLAVTAVGHPLIPDAGRVCNDFRLNHLGDVAIITGSNMAGKSSFLRTLGVNLVLAYAGGPVLAQSFQARLFRLYTSIRVSDSVTDGFSYFYAEVRRLQGLLAALETEDERPLFFLIDEIFRGTNNRERLIGSRAFVRALVGGHGVGLIATHDLELVKLAEERTAVHNFHFRDDVVDGKMVFDYTLRPGPCPTTNALKIMQLAGLPVADADLQED